MKKKRGIIAGCFDLIHPGYIKMMADAKTVCDHLVVALHDDPSTERKSKFKPVHSMEERKMILSAIRYVDEIVVYDTEEGLLDLLRWCDIDVRVIGTDYKGKNFTGKELDMEIHYHERDHNWSYSDLRRKIAEET
jgi:glycerol-3-phosphate cytidylyltransferase